MTVLMPTPISREEAVRRVAQAWQDYDRTIPPTDATLDDLVRELGATAQDRECSPDYMAAVEAQEMALRWLDR